MDSRNPAIKRLKREYDEILESNDDPSPLPFMVYPLEENFFEWHFTLLGPTDSVYEGGRYHGKIQFPPDYPFSPPSLQFLTVHRRVLNHHYGNLIAEWQVSGEPKNLSQRHRFPPRTLAAGMGSTDDPVGRTGSFHGRGSGCHRVPSFPPGGTSKARQRVLMMMIFNR